MRDRVYGNHNVTTAGYINTGEEKRKVIDRVSSGFLKFPCREAFLLFLIIRYYFVGVVVQWPIPTPPSFDPTKPAVRPMSMLRNWSWWLEIPSMPVAILIAPCMF
jgi:hypothetical protein